MSESKRKLSPLAGVLIHLVVMVAGIALATLANREWMPSHAWARWLGIAWGIVFLAHLVYAGVLGLASLGGHNPT
jgi:hypothetical protein